MDGFKGQPDQVLVFTVMAALSKRSRHSAHPADHRRLLAEAMHVAIAVETAFLLAERPAAPAPGANGRQGHLIPTYE